MALNEVQERALVKTLFLAPIQRTWESYQGSCPCASPWKQCFLFLAISCTIILYYFIQKPLYPLIESSELFQGCSFVLLPISSLSALRPRYNTVYTTLSLLSFCLCCVCDADCAQTDLCYLSSSSERRLRCYLSHNLHVISKVGLSLMHMHVRGKDRWRCEICGWLEIPPDISKVLTIFRLY